MPYRVSRERFKRLVEQALALIPGEFKEHFDNIAVMVEERPTGEESQSIGVPRDELMGLFRGRAIDERGGFFEALPQLPDEIIIFRRNIEEYCDSERELIDEIRLTVLHEVGHYLGLSEEELEQYE